MSEREPSAASRDSLPSGPRPSHHRDGEGAITEAGRCAGDAAASNAANDQFTTVYGKPLPTPEPIEPSAACHHDRVTLDAMEGDTCWDCGGSLRESSAARGRVLTASEIGERILGAHIVAVGPLPDGSLAIEWYYLGTDDDRGWLRFHAEDVHFEDEGPSYA